jgi:hypothetical protein
LISKSNVHDMPGVPHHAPSLGLYAMSRARTA